MVIGLVSPLLAPQSGKHAGCQGGVSDDPGALAHNTIVLYHGRFRSDLWPHAKYLLWHASGTLTVVQLAASPPLCPARYPPQSVAACLCRAARRILSRMGTKSRETIYGASVRAAAERATEARKEADRLAVEAWNKRMLGFQGPAQPSPALGDALNAGYRYLEVKCLGCDTHQTVALDIVRRPKATPVHELERYMRCRQCSEVRRYPYKRSHLVALRANKISADDPPSTWWPGER